MIAGASVTATIDADVADEVAGNTKGPLAASGPFVYILDVSGLALGLAPWGCCAPAA
ncbi:hypothetical protein TBR22_A31720 [Luteitalea sp. TBR-22]|nr:hypothetical protein TBR22_A31720 [Luteitalea sp. TBR-22]